MIPEKVFHQILARGEGWCVSAVDYVEPESQGRIRVADLPALWPTARGPHCQAKAVAGYDPAPERRGRHLNLCQLESEIVCALPRGHGNAVVVFDKFHGVSQGVQAVEEVRRKETRQDALAREPLARTRWLGRKNPEAWTAGEQARGTQPKDKPRVTGLADALRWELQKAYASGTVDQARSRFQAWCRGVQIEAEALTPGWLEPMRKAADRVERHLAGILAHWKQGLTTAFLAGLNSLFSATKRKARGYRSTEYPIARLYFVAGKLEIPHYG